MQNNRFIYIDLLRGIAILFIVFGHIPMFCYGDGASHLPSFRAFTSMVQLPIFFFVSGFVCNTEKMLIGGGKTLVNKFRQLIMPALFWGGLYMILNEISIFTAITDKFKSGYWFTFLLFEFILLQFGVEYLARHFRIKNEARLYTLWLVSMAVVMYGISLPSVANLFGYTGGVLGLPLFRYYLYFVCGVLLRRNMLYLTSHKYKDVFVSLCMMLLLVLAISNWILDIQFSGMFFHLNMVVFELTALLVLFVAFYKNRMRFSNENSVVKALGFIGRRTLDIYMLHYFFLPKDLHLFGTFFSTHDAPVVECAFSGVLTILIVAVCIAVGELIRQGGFLPKYILGTK